MGNCDNRTEFIRLVVVVFQMIVFKNLNDKDLFEVRYCSLFAGRFLCGKMEKQAELELLSKLTVHQDLR